MAALDQRGHDNATERRISLQPFAKAPMCGCHAGELLLTRLTGDPKPLEVGWHVHGDLQSELYVESEI